MGWKQHLGDISPIYGGVTGEGMMGQMLNPDEAAKIAEKEQIAAEADRKKQKGMKKGGSASSRADGCAIRGKTRA
jgi:hypothetical protein